MFGMRPRVCVFVFIVCAALVSAEDLRVELASGSNWMFPDGHARVEQGELVLDGRQSNPRAFYTPQEWTDVSLKASFLVESAETGVLACGFIVRAKDGRNYYYVHYDRGQAILCRSDENNGWNEIKRAGNLDKPAGVWHRGEVQCQGDRLRVFLNDVLLYEAQDAALASGRVGFYAGEGVAHVKDIVISGEARPASGPLTFPPRPYTFVCEDAGAGGYEAFPDVCRLQDGRLISVFYAGYGHVALPNEQLPLGGRVSYCLSTDEGRTWTAAQTLYDGPDDDRDPSIVQLKNGRIICNYFTLRKAEGKNPPWDGLGTWMVYSDDNLATWSEPRLISEDYYCSSPIRQLSDGRLVLGLYGEKDGKGWGAAVFSEDNGESWGPVIDIDNGGMNLDAETDIIQLKDGSLYAAQRGRDETMGWSVSKDGGKTWSVSLAMGFPGHCPYLHRSPSGTIYMAHRLPQTSLHYSRDECQTWSENVPVDSVGGAYPSMVTLKDGSILIVYYEEGAGSSIRAKRFVETPEGIEWKPLE
ncbi:MAG: DUF1080 domain-containing protein [Candidatus Hydrogenedentes bacterium]|nr:DUF1080 domain-containing protein [Candidatus Hydrogenedentota bacterium]